MSNQPQPTPQMQALATIAENTGVTLVTVNEILELLKTAATAADNLIKLLAQPTRPAAQQAQPAADATYSTFTADDLVMTYTDEGEPSYKLLGKPWTKYGIKIWPEVLPAIGINPATLKPGHNPITPTTVKALNGEHFPKKVIGLADQQQPAAPTQPTDDDNMPF